MKTLVRILWRSGGAKRLMLVACGHTYIVPDTWRLGRFKCLLCYEPRYAGSVVPGVVSAGPRCPSSVTLPMPTSAPSVGKPSTTTPTCTPHDLARDEARSAESRKDPLNGS